MSRVLPLFLFLVACGYTATAARSAPQLTPSGCIVISSNYQVVQNYSISCAGDAITCNNYYGVTIHNNAIRAGGNGINANACNNLSITNNYVESTSAPPSGSYTYGVHIAVRLINSTGPIITNLATYDMRGVYLQNSPEARISSFACTNPRSDPDNYGTCMAFYNSGNFSLDSFYFYANLSIATTGDNINIYGSSGLRNTISNGLIDGNTQNIGNGIEVQNDGSGNPSFAAISNVDIIHWCNGAIGLNNTTNASVVNVRVGYSTKPCADGRNPSSNGTPFQTYNYDATPNTTGTSYVHVGYAQIAGTGPLIWNLTTIKTNDITNLGSFTPRSPVVPVVPSPGS